MYVQSRKELQSASKGIKLDNKEAALNGECCLQKSIQSEIKYGKLIWVESIV